MTLRKINQGLYKDLSAIERWELNSKGWRTLFQVVGKKKALDRREEVLLQEDLLQVEACLQENPEDKTLRNRLRSAKDMLRKLQNLRSQGLKVRSKLNWIGSKFSFRYLTDKGMREHIEQIHVDGVTFTKLEDIMGHFFLQKFFSPWMIIEMAAPGQGN